MKSQKKIFLDGYKNYTYYIVPVYDVCGFCVDLFFAKAPDHCRVHLGVRWTFNRSIPPDIPQRGCIGTAIMPEGTVKRQPEIR